MVPFWDRCTTHFSLFLVGIGMLTDGVLTHGNMTCHVALPLKSTNRGCSAPEIKVDARFRRGHTQKPGEIWRAPPLGPPQTNSRLPNHMVGCLSFEGVVRNQDPCSATTLLPKFWPQLKNIWVGSNKGEPQKISVVLYIFKHGASTRHTPISDSGP